MAIEGVAGHEPQEFRDEHVWWNVNFGLETKLKFCTVASRRLSLGGLFNVQLMDTDWADFE